jgi:hypothetical protein
MSAALHGYDTFERDYSYNRPATTFEDSYSDGQQAYIDGLTLCDNPHPNLVIGFELRAAWDEGWHDAAWND